LVNFVDFSSFFGKLVGFNEIVDFSRFLTKLKWLEITRLYYGLVTFKILPRDGATPLGAFLTREF